MKNIVFDFGGVVFRWQPHELLRRVLPERVADEAAARRLVADFFGPDWSSFDRGTIEIPALVKSIAKRVGFAPEEVSAVIDAVVGELEPQVDTVALIHRLHDAGHALYYLSNMPAPYADHLERSHSFFDRFSDGVFSAHVKVIKPEPEIFEMATRRFGIDPDDTIFIDDLASNVAAARAHGWKAIQFVDAAQCEAELMPWL